MLGDKSKNIKHALKIKRFRFIFSDSVLNIHFIPELFFFSNPLRFDCIEYKLYDEFFNFSLGNLKKKYRENY